MKKLLSTILIFLLLFSLISCGNNTSNNKSSNTNNNSSSSDDNSSSDENTNDSSNINQKKFEEIEKILEQKGYEVTPTDEDELSFDYVTPVKAIDIEDLENEFILYYFEFNSLDDIQKLRENDDKPFNEKVTLLLLFSAFAFPPLLPISS